jgi:hypothetical protein
MPIAISVLVPVVPFVTLWPVFCLRGLRRPRGLATFAHFLKRSSRD